MDPLDFFFRPRSVALIGATERPGSVGRTVMSNLLAGTPNAEVFPVNPKWHAVLDVPAFPSVTAIGRAVDLAVIATPAETVPGVIRECVAARVPAALILAAGFRETGAHGAELERAILEEARRGPIRVLGPNSFGILSPATGIAATLAAAVPRSGSVAFLSQSGAICSAVLDWSLRELVGFSAVVSTGSMLDIGWGDLIDYFGGDPHTRSIVLYMESIGDARAFLSAAREVAMAKPIIVIKAGRTDAAARAAATHTGALTGSDAVLDAAFRRCGVLRVNRLSDLFYMAEILSKQPRPRGPRLAIVTNAGGPGVLAADALLLDKGVLADLLPATLDELAGFLPAHWSRQNPVDILDDAGAERYGQAVQTVAKDPNCDGILAILAPQNLTAPASVAERLKSGPKPIGKPLLACFMGGAQVAAAEEILNRGDIPTFPYPDTAAHAFHYMWKFSENLRAIYETPALAGDSEPDVARASGLIERARSAARTLLTESESKELLEAYGIPIARATPVFSEEEAVAAAARTGYPVALKLHSETVTQKRAAGGVKLHLHDRQEVERAYREIAACDGFLGASVQPMVLTEGFEILLGSSPDPQFGPVLLFGSGGRLAEVHRDFSHGLPPLNSTLARRLMERTRIFSAVREFQPGLLEDLLVRFSRLAAEQRRVREIEINPLLVSEEGAIALDARVVLYPSSVRDEDLPVPAVRSYPAQYVTAARLRDGTEIAIRPIRPEDEPLMVRFHEGLSERSVYFRYFQMVKLSQRVSHERLTRICFIDYNRQIALVAERAGPPPEILGVARMTRLRKSGSAEFAVIISDTVQRSGLGTELLRRLVEVARAEKLERLVGEILPENRGMQRVCEKAGFTLKYSMEDGVVAAELKL